jgi:hypothetical protein
MSAHGRHAEAFRVPMLTHRSGTPPRVLFGLVAVVLLFVQAIHPGIHPAEVIGPHTDTHFGCPISHAAADLPSGLQGLPLTPLVLVPILEPRLWVSHLRFCHTVAPRPPPTIHR